MLILIYLIKLAFFIFAAALLIRGGAKVSRIVYSPGGTLTTAVPVALSFLIPYAGWFLAAFLLIRLSNKLSDAEIWPDSFILGVTVIPALWILQHFLF